MERLRALILEDLGLSPERVGVIVTDGAVAGLSHVVRTLLRRGDEMIAADPGWKWPLVYARAAGAVPVELPIYDPAQGYRLSVPQLRAAATERTRLIYLVDPNNPLGSRIPADDIARIAEIARAADATTHDMIGRPAAAAPNALGSSVIAQHAAIARLVEKRAWLPGVLRADRVAKQAIAEAVACVPGLALPVDPSHGKFVTIEVAGAGIRPEALCFAYRRDHIMIRQGGYHTAGFADRFVKVSTTVPAAWIERFCELLPSMVEAARGINEVPDLF